MISRNVERRQSRRIPARMEAYMITADKNYMGYIQNVSREGFEFSLSSSVKDGEDFIYDTISEIFFQLPSGEAMNLSCEVKWLSERSSVNGPLTIGMKIIERSSKFMDLIKTFDIISVN